MTQTEELLLEPSMLWGNDYIVYFLEHFRWDFRLYFTANKTLTVLLYKYNEQTSNKAHTKTHILVS